MGKRKPGFDLGRHQDAGEFLAPAESRMVTLSTDIENAYVKDSKIVRLAKRTATDMRRLKDALDGLLHNEHPNATGKEIQELHRVYYPRKKG